MPANLPPRYYHIEKRYRDAQSDAERISCLEEMMSIIPKHKGTDKLRAEIRKRISKQKAASQIKKGADRRDSIFKINREGAGQVVIVGPTYVGKSSLLAALTHVTPQISAISHPTWRPVPKMMSVLDIQLQLVDTPSLSRDYIEAGLIELIRRSDLLLLVLDVQSDPTRQLEDMIELLKNNKVIPCCLKQDADPVRGTVFIPMQIVANKNDDTTTDENLTIARELLAMDWDILGVSAKTGRHLETLKQAMVQRLEIIRVYSKIPGQSADLDVPFVLKKGGTVGDFATKIHLDIARNFKMACVWGHDGHDGHKVQRDHRLHDGDIVEIHV